MTYHVEGPIMTGASQVLVVSKTEVAGARIRGIDLFNASKKPICVVVRSGSKVQRFDIPGTGVDPAKIDALIPDLRDADPP